MIKQIDPSKQIAIVVFVFVYTFSFLLFGLFWEEG